MLSRRGFLFGIGAALVAAPAIIPIERLMKVVALPLLRARHVILRPGGVFSKEVILAPGEEQRFFLNDNGLLDPTSELAAAARQKWVTILSVGPAEVIDSIPVSGLEAGDYMGIRNASRPV